MADFVDPARFYHDVDPFFNAVVQDLPGQAQADDIGVIDEVMSLALADERPSLPLLDGADQPRQAVGIGQEFMPIRRLPIRFLSNIGFEILSVKGVQLLLGLPFIAAVIREA